METGRDGRELNVGHAAQVEVVASVAEREAARPVAKAIESMRRVAALPYRDEDVFAVSIEVQIGVWRGQDALAQRQPLRVLKGHAEKQLWRSRTRQRRYPGGSRGFLRVNAGCHEGRSQESHRCKSHARSRHIGLPARVPRRK